MSDSVPAGWYPTPDGKQRYWDGERWTNLPFEGSVDEVSPQNPELVPKKPITKRLTLWIALGALLLVLLAGGGIAWKANVDAQAAAAAAAMAEQEKVDAAKAAQERKDEAERQSRADAVLGIEASVQTMAEGHAADGVINGPIIDVNCSPVGGGSTDDLTEKTTVFECFVANKDNGDGTMSGYYYNATMNWDSGSYTYGLGRP